MLVSLIIPCFNERDALPRLFLALAALPEFLAPEWGFELLTLDDGSEDGTGDLLDRLCESASFTARSIRFPENRGLGAVLRDGIPSAKGDILVTYDADLPYPLTDLKRLLLAVQSGADVATASPWHPEGDSHGLGISRTLPSKAVSMLYRLRMGKRRARDLHTFTCGFRAWKRPMLLQCLPQRDGFTATAEMLLKALRAGAEVTEIPSRLRVRREGQSKMKIVRTAWAHLGLWIKGGA